MTGQIRDIVVDDHKRRSQREAAVDFQGRTLVVGGEFEFPGVGEALVDLKFPVVYTQKPLLLGVHGDLTNGATTTGHLPTVSGIIHHYETTPRTPNTSYYVGCQLAVVVTGDASQSMWIHWHVTGCALINPVLGAIDTNDTV